MIEKGNLISEGKAKSLYETQNQNELLMVYRDDTSAFDGKKKEALKGKGEINNKFNAHIMQYLDKNGIRTHHIENVTDTESLVHRLDMLPVECVVRNIAVSYTHLRAHETKANLVCRLLLEKKNLSV